MAGPGGVEFSFSELMTVVEDLMRVADELLGAGDDVNAFLIDQIANRLLTRAFGTD